MAVEARHLLFSAVDEEKESLRLTFTAEGRPIRTDALDLARRVPSATTIPLLQAQVITVTAMKMAENALQVTTLYLDWFLADLHRQAVSGVGNAQVFAAVTALRARFPGLVQLQRASNSTETVADVANDAEQRALAAMAGLRGGARLTRSSDPRTRRREERKRAILQRKRARAGEERRLARRAKAVERRAKRVADLALPLVQQRVEEVLEAEPDMTPAEAAAQGAQMGKVLSMSPAAWKEAVDGQAVVITDTAAFVHADGDGLVPPPVDHATSAANVIRNALLDCLDSVSSGASVWTARGAPAEGLARLRETLLAVTQQWKAFGEQNRILRSVHGLGRAKTVATMWRTLLMAIQAESTVPVVADMLSILGVRHNEQDYEAEYAVRSRSLKEKYRGRGGRGDRLHGGGIHPSHMTPQVLQAEVLTLGETMSKRVTLLQAAFAAKKRWVTLYKTLLSELKRMHRFATYLCRIEGAGAEAVAVVNQWLPREPRAIMPTEPGVMPWMDAREGASTTCKALHADFLRTQTKGKGKGKARAKGKVVAPKKSATESPMLQNAPTAVGLAAVAVRNLPSIHTVTEHINTQLAEVAKAYHEDTVDKGMLGEQTAQQGLEFLVSAALDPAKTALQTRDSAADILSMQTVKNFTKDMLVTGAGAAGMVSANTGLEGLMREFFPDASALRDGVTTSTLNSLIGVGYRKATLLCGMIPAAAIAYEAWAAVREHQASGRSGASAALGAAARFAVFTGSRWAISTAICSVMGPSAIVASLATAGYFGVRAANRKFKVGRAYRKMQRAIINARAAAHASPASIDSVTAHHKAKLGDAADSTVSISMVRNFMKWSTPHVRLHASSWLKADPRLKWTPTMVQLNAQARTFICLPTPPTPKAGTGAGAGAGGGPLLTFEQCQAAVVAANAKADAAAKAAGASTVISDAQKVQALEAWTLARNLIANEQRVQMTARVLYAVLVELAAFLDKHGDKATGEKVQVLLNNHPKPWDGIQSLLEAVVEVNSVMQPLVTNLQAASAKDADNEDLAVGASLVNAVFHLNVFLHRLALQIVDSPTTWTPSSAIESYPTFQERVLMAQGAIGSDLPTEVTVVNLLLQLMTLTDSTQEATIWSSLSQARRGSGGKKASEKGDSMQAQINKWVGGIVWSQKVRLDAEKGFDFTLQDEDVKGRVQTPFDGVVTTSSLMAWAIELRAVAETLRQRMRERDGIRHKLPSVAQMNNPAARTEWLNMEGALIAPPEHTRTDDNIDVLNDSLTSSFAVLVVGLAACADAAVRGLASFQGVSMPEAKAKLRRQVVGGIMQSQSATFMRLTVGLFSDMVVLVGNTLAKLQGFEMALVDRTQFGAWDLEKSLKAAHGLHTIAQRLFTTHGAAAVPTHVSGQTTPSIPLELAIDAVASLLAHQVTKVEAIVRTARSSKTLLSIFTIPPHALFHDDEKALQLAAHLPFLQRQVSASASLFHLWFTSIRATVPVNVQHVTAFKAQLQWALLDKVRRGVVLTDGVVNSTAAAVVEGMGVALGPEVQQEAVKTAAEVKRRNASPMWRKLQQIATLFSGVCSAAKAETVIGILKGQVTIWESLGFSFLLFDSLPFLIAASFALLPSATAILLSGNSWWQVLSVSAVVSLALAKDVAAGAMAVDTGVTLASMFTSAATAQLGVTRDKWVRMMSPFRFSTQVANGLTGLQVFAAARAADLVEDAANEETITKVTMAHARKLAGFNTAARMNFEDVGLTMVVRPGLQSWKTIKERIGAAKGVDAETKASLTSLFTTAFEVCQEKWASQWTTAAPGKAAHTIPLQQFDTLSGVTADKSIVLRPTVDLTTQQLSVAMWDKFETAQKLEVMEAPKVPPLALTTIVARMQT